MSILKQKNNEFLKNKVYSINSKLFLDMELSDENILPHNNAEDSDSSTKYSSLRLKDCLSNDLIKELDLPLNNQKDELKLNNNTQIKWQNNYNPFIENNKNNNNLEINNNIYKINFSKNNNLLSTINKGLKFNPHYLNNNYMESSSTKFQEKNKIFYFIQKNKNLFKKNKRVDWLCSFCNNINYSFRVKCNRCGASKEVSNYI